MRILFTLGLAALSSCGRIGFDENSVQNNNVDMADAATIDSALNDSALADCSGSLLVRTQSTVNEAGGEIVVVVSDLSSQCLFQFVVDGAGGGRGNHGGVDNNDADGGAGGRIEFDWQPTEAGELRIIVGGGLGGFVGARTLDDPEPGAGGGGSSSVEWVAASSTMLAIAGGGGGGGWAEWGTDGGGGNGECAPDGDGGGGCQGVGGFVASGGGQGGGSCPLVDGERLPCGGPGGWGSSADDTGGFGVGAGAGSSDNSNGSGGGGGGYGGGADGGGQGGEGAGGGAYVAASVAVTGGTTGGAANGANYADSLELVGGDGVVTITLSPRPN